MSDDRTSDNESSRRGRDQGTADELGWADKAADEELKAQSGRGSLGDDGSSHRGPPTLQVISSTPEVTSKPPATGEVELPHWTDPPTGEVPAVIAGEPGLQFLGLGSLATNPKGHIGRQLLKCVQ